MRADGPREAPRVTDPRAESVPLAGSRGNGHACTSPSGGSAALCAPACHGRCQGRRISPRMGVRVTDSGPKASPLRGPAAAEDWACRGVPRGRSCTPREAPKGKLRATECSKGEVARHERRQGRRCRPRCPCGPFSLGRFRGTLCAGVSREGPRVTFFATGGAEGDAFRRGRGQGRRIRGRKRRPCGVPRQRRAGRARRARG